MIEDVDFIDLPVQVDLMLVDDGGDLPDSDDLIQDPVDRAPLQRFDRLPQLRGDGVQRFQVLRHDVQFILIPAELRPPVQILLELFSGLQPEDKRRGGVLQRLRVIDFSAHSLDAVDRAADGLKHTHAFAHSLSSSSFSTCFMVSMAAASDASDAFFAKCWPSTFLDGLFSPGVY